MIEVVALMIGDIVQCYSEEKYEILSPLGRECLSKKVFLRVYLVQGAPQWS